MTDRLEKLKTVRAALLELPPDATITLRVRDLLHFLIARVEEFEHPAFEWGVR